MPVLGIYDRYLGSETAADCFGCKMSFSLKELEVCCLRHIYFRRLHDCKQCFIWALRTRKMSSKCSAPFGKWSRLCRCFIWQRVKEVGGTSIEVHAPDDGCGLQTGQSWSACAGCPCKPFCSKRGVRTASKRVLNLTSARPGGNRMLDFCGDEEWRKPDSVDLGAWKEEVWHNWEIAGSITQSKVYTNVS